MRDPDRIFRILNLIQLIWLRCPDMRLGQLLSNFAQFNTDPYYYEDDRTEQKLKEALFMLSKERHEGLR